MSESEEIEVEVVEIVNERPASHSGQGSSSNSERPAPPSSGPRTEGSQRKPFGGMPARPLRIPGYLWPLVVVFGLIFLLLAVLVLIVVAIPFLILRTILRLLLPNR